MDVTSTFDFKGFSDDNVRRAVRSLPNKTLTGTDQISYRLLKAAGPTVVGPLTTSFNCSLRLRQVPKEWKKAVIIPVFEGGHKDRRGSTNNRQISLTSCVARTMEKLLNMATSFAVSRRIPCSANISQDSYLVTPQGRSCAFLSTIGKWLWMMANMFNLHSWT